MYIHNDKKNYLSKTNLLFLDVVEEGENAIEEEIEDEIDENEQEEDLINNINRELFYSELDREESKDSCDGDDSGADENEKSNPVEYTSGLADIPA